MLTGRLPSLLQLDFRTPPGFDRTRNAEIGNKDIKFKHLEEAFTSEHWLVRIYKVKNLDNREPLDHKPRSMAPKQKYTSRKVSARPPPSAGVKQSHPRERETLTLLGFIRASGLDRRRGSDSLVTAGETRLSTSVVNKHSLVRQTLNPPPPVQVCRCSYLDLK